MAFILSILQNYSWTSDSEEDLQYHRIVEAWKWTYAQRSYLGDPFDPLFTEDIQDLVTKLTSQSYAFETSLKINDSWTFNDPFHYGANFSLPEDHGTTHLSILAPNGDAVAVTSTINRRFSKV